MSAHKNNISRKPNDPANSFEVPEGYFANLPERLLNRVKEEEALSNEKRPLIDVLRPYLYLAAMFVGLALIINVLPMIHPRASKDSMASTEPQTTGITYSDTVSDDEVFEQFVWEDTQDEYLVSTYFAD